MYDDFLKTIKQLGAFEVCGEYWLNFNIEGDIICITYSLKKKDTFDFFIKPRGTKRCIINEKISTLRGFVEFLMSIISITAHAKGMSYVLDELKTN